MSREQIYQEIEHTMGIVPSMFKAVPDATLELEWQLFKAKRPISHRLQIRIKPVNYLF